MNKSFSEMTNPELNRYLSEHRNDEKAFSQALEVLLSRKKDGFKYHYNMPSEEAEAIFKAKINQLVQE
jgi:predicted CopG family antitoxin